MLKVGRPVLAAGQRSVLGSAPTLQVRTGSNELSPPLAQLQYQASDSISHTLHEQIAGRMMAYDPAQAAPIQTLLVSGEVWRDFDGLLSRLGLSSRNIADVMTSYYVGSWEVVNQTVASAAFWLGARKQIAASLSRSPEILLMSDSEKQRSSETLGIVTAVTSSAWQAMQVQGDQIGLLALQSSVHQSLLQQGIDMKRLKLSQRGFAPG